MILTIILVIFLSFNLGFLLPRFRDFLKVYSMTIDSVDFSRLSDGQYMGDSQFSRATVEVAVTIKNHLIKNIETIKNLTGEQAQIAEEVFKRVQNSQSLHVDTISGATTTRKALLKTTENSL